MQLVLGDPHGDGRDPSNNLRIIWKAQVSYPTAGLRRRDEEKTAFSQLAPGAGIAITELDKEDGPIKFAGPGNVVNPLLAGVNFNEGARSGQGEESVIYSTMLAEHGNDVKVVQELMRHAKLSTTMEIHTHPRMEKKREAQSKVVDMLFGRQRPEAVAS